MWVLGLLLLLFAAAACAHAVGRQRALMRRMRLCAHELRGLATALHGQAGARGEPALLLTAAGVHAVADSLHQHSPRAAPALRPERIDPAEAVATAVAAARAAILPGTRLWRLPSAAAPDLWADARALRHILGHTLADAIRATGERDWIEIEFESSATDLAIVITDEGAGLTLPTGSAAVPRDSRGIGLRLALARSLLHAHGGHMDIESAPGVGTRVRLVFPAHRLRRSRDAPAPATPALA